MVVTQRLARWWAWCGHPWVAGALALTAYLLLAGNHGGDFRVSTYNYFNYLADAFLHGQLHLRLEPVTTHDLTHFDHRLYLYWSPFPAVVLMPFVALWGVSFSDIALTCVVGALNVVLVADIVRLATARRVIRLSAVQRAFVTLFFAFGTVHLTLAPFGRVWYSAQVIDFCCTALAFWSALRFRGLRAALLVGLSLTAAMLTRNHTVLTGLWPVLFLLMTQRRPGPTWVSRVPWSTLAAIVVPVGLGVATLALYNQARFGSPFENGLRWHQMDAGFAADYAKYGAFHPHYLATNAYYELINYPLPFRDDSYMGGSLFLMSPVFFAAFLGRRVLPRWSWGALVASIVAIAIPIGLLMGTGSINWGPRYTFDFTMPLLLLTAAGLRRVSTRALAFATVASIVPYTVGAIDFMRHM